MRSKRNKKPDPATIRQVTGARCKVPLCGDLPEYLATGEGVYCRHHSERRGEEPPAAGTQCEEPGCTHAATDWYTPGPDAGWSAYCAPHAKEHWGRFW
jgi:hypothetical protein